MENSKAEISPDLELQRLEVQVEALIEMCDNLRKDNRALRTRQQTLIKDRASLTEKTELAKSRIEAMIARLKMLEDSA